MFLVLYVDDGLIAAQSAGVVDQLLQTMNTQFEATSSFAKFYLGIQIDYDQQQRLLKVHQHAYTNSVIEKFAMANCNSTSTPADPSIEIRRNEGPKAEVPFRRLIGNLMYLAIATRPDITFIVYKLCQHLDNPSEVHWQAAKRVIRYLKATPDYGIVFDGNSSTQNQMKAYTDADYAMCVDTRKSTSRVVIILNKGPILWLSRKQGVVTDSTTYAEYVAMHDGAREVVWLRRILDDLGVSQQQPTPLFCDNTAARKLATGESFNGRSKHIEIDYHYTREQHEKTVNIQPISTKLQLADIFTKPLHPQTFGYLRSSLNIF